MRQISSPMLAQLTSNFIRPAFLAIITFKSETAYISTTPFNIAYNGHTYLGVGSFGKISPVVEGTDVQAYGMTVELSAIDPTLLSECLTDIQMGAPATIYFALLDGNGTIYGTPYPLFVGTVDKPSMQIGTKQMTISLQLENKLANLQRSNMRRYTSADQNLYFPSDNSFAFVESLNDQALLWQT